MAALPYMQFHVSEYLADTTHLTTEEHGAYLLLIFRYWQTGAPLPNDDVLLARFARVSDDKWPQIRSVIQHLFNTCSTNWQHARIDYDLAEVQAKVLARSGAGKASAAAKKRNAIKAAKSAAARVSGDVSTQINKCSTSVQQKVNKVEVEEEVLSSKDLPEESGEVSQFDTFWTTYPRKVGKDKAKAKFSKLKPPDQLRAISDVQARIKSDPQWLKGNGEFIPYPTTYLNGSGWADEWKPVIKKQEWYGV